VGMNCPPPKTGCAAHVEQDDCNDDSSCKWCQAYTQGWPSCEDVSQTEEELQSTCDKPDPVEIQATAVSNCGQFESYGECFYNIECKWCANGNNPWDPEAADFNWTAGACIDYATETPVGMNCPPPKTGCAAHVEQSSCNDDSSCKWCQAYTQGWPSCEDVSKTEKELQSTCDKPDPKALLRGALSR